MKTLTYYEFKKLIMKKETAVVIIALLIYFTAQTVIALSQTEYTTTDETLNGIEAVKALRASQTDTTGPLTEVRISEVIRTYHALHNRIENLEANGELKETVYIEQWQRYEGIEAVICKVFSEEGEYNPYILSNLNEKDGKAFYELYRKKLELKGISLKYSNERPLYYGYYLGWLRLLQDLWIHSLVLSIFACVLLAGVFTSEKEFGMDSVLSSSKLGKAPLSKVKVKTALLTATALYWVPMTLYLITTFLVYGLNGYQVSLQVVSMFSRLNINLLQAVLICLMLSFIGYMAFAVGILYLSKRFSHTLPVSLCAIAFLLIPVFIPISEKLNVFQLLLHMFPSHLMNASELAKHFSVATWIGAVAVIAAMPLAIRRIVE